MPGKIKKKFEAITERVNTQNFILKSILLRQQSGQEEDSNDETNDSTENNPKQTQVLRLNLKESIDLPVQSLFNYNNKAVEHQA